MGTETWAWNGHLLRSIFFSNLQVFVEIFVIIFVLQIWENRKRKFKRKHQILTFWVLSTCVNQTSIKFSKKKNNFIIFDGNMTDKKMHFIAFPILPQKAFSYSQKFSFDVWCQNICSFRSRFSRNPKFTNFFLFLHYNIFCFVFHAILIWH